MDPATGLGANFAAGRVGAAGLLILRRLNEALELKDHETRGHSERVERHIAHMATAMKVPTDRLAELLLAAALHDVGKVAISDAILRKTSSLTEDEFDQMKEHSNVGAGMLSYVAGRAAVDAVRYHHERWDGRGYPDGLAGRDIPIFARMIAVADTYDAIRSPRPYRAASSHELAIEVLVDGAGSQFDPDCVIAFVETLPSDAEVQPGGSASTFL